MAVITRVLLLHVGNSEFSFNFLYFFATLLWFFKEMILDLPYCFTTWATRFSCFFFQNQKKRWQKATYCWRYLRKHGEYSTSNSNTLIVTCIYYPILCHLKQTMAVHCSIFWLVFFSNIFNVLCFLPVLFRFLEINNWICLFM